MDCIGCRLSLIALILLSVTGESVWIERANTTWSYSFNGNVSSWSDARKHCKQEGGDLLVIKSEEEHKWLQNVVDSAANWWTGLAEVDSKWRWVDGSSFEESKIKWTTADGSETEECTHFDRSSLKVQKQTCGAYKCFICHYGSIDDVVMTDVEFHGLKSTWAEAKDACKSTGSSLISLDNCKQRNMMLYIILHDENTCDSWWISQGTDPLEDCSVTTEEPKNPKNATNEQTKYCGTIHKGHLVDYPCNQNYSSICKRSKTWLNSTVGSDVKMVAEPSESSVSSPSGLAVALKVSMGCLALVALAMMMMLVRRKFRKPRPIATESSSYASLADMGVEHAFNEGLVQGDEVEIFSRPRSHSTASTERTRVD